MWNPRKSKPSSMCTTRVFSGDSRNPIWGQHGRRLLPQRLGMPALPGHHHHEVVRVTDEPPVPEATPLALSPLLVVAHQFPALTVEMIIQHREGDIGQQRGEDPALEGAGQRVLEQLRTSS
jgi:hypothetical protein